MDCRPAQMTMLDWLRWTHPDHCQRIAEEVWRQDPRNAEAVLAGPPGPYPVAGCFVWAQSEEGHEYWQRLSGEPFKAKNNRSDGYSLIPLRTRWRKS